jgi:RNA polymerase sigma factor (sigma-70 family)
MREGARLFCISWCNIQVLPENLCNKSSCIASFLVMTDQQRNRIAGFFKREYGRMAYFVRALIDDAADHDAEDIIQDIAANIFLRADITRPIDDVASYIYQALRNRIVDIFRRRHQHVSLDQYVDEKEGAATLKDIIADEQADIDKLMNDNCIKRRLMDSIEALPKDQKAILIATEFDDKSFTELSAKWNVPVGTLLARKSRAIAQLRLIFNRE